MNILRSNKISKDIMNIKCSKKQIKNFTVKNLLDEKTKKKFTSIIDELTTDPIDALDRTLDLESRTPENDWWKNTLRYYINTRYDNKASGPNVIMNGSYKVIYNVDKYHKYASSVELVNREIADKRYNTFFKLKEKFINGEDCILALPESQKLIKGDVNDDEPEVYLIITKWEKCVMDGFDLFNDLVRRKQTAEHKSMMNQLHYDLGRSLKQIHQKGVYIVDLKPENMLVCNNKLKYADLDDVIMKEDIRKAVIQRINLKNSKTIQKSDKKKIISTLICVREIVTAEFSYLLFSRIFDCFKGKIEKISNKNINDAVELYCSLYAYIDWYAWSMVVCLNEPRYLNIFLSEQWDQKSKIPPVLRKPIVDNSDYNPNLDVLTNIQLYKKVEYNSMQKALNFMSFFIDQYVYWKDKKCKKLNINIDLVEPVKWIESTFDSSKRCIQLQEKSRFKLKF